MQKRIGALFLLSIFSFFIISCSNFPIIIHTSTYKQDNNNYKIGDTIKPFSKINFDDGNYAAYLIIDKADFDDLNSAIQKKKCLKTTSISVLKEMQKTWSFIYKERDVATVTSSFLLFNNNKLIFSSGIVLDKEKQGLQSREFGWIELIEKKSIIESCKNFKPVNRPIVFL